MDAINETLATLTGTAAPPADPATLIADTRQEVAKALTQYAGRRRCCL